MPEGHLLHRLARDHAEMVGQPVRATSPQGRFAGVGNVLRAETLVRAGVHPSRPAATLDRDAFARIWTALLDLMSQSVDEGQILPAGRTVYKEATCRACGTPIESWSLAGRTAYACPRCQPS